MGTKLHLACGSVYLDGYVNIDIVGTKDPAVIEKNRTTLDKYYTRPYSRGFVGRDIRPQVAVDVIADVLDLPFSDNSIDEILTVNLLDHLRRQDIDRALGEWRRVLKPKGKLIIDLGDIRGNAEEILKAKTQEEYEWAIRLFYCHSRDPYDSHRWGYTGDYLKEILTNKGFKHIWTKSDYIVHAYPSFQICVEKEDHEDSRTN
jgi:predicted SAM-dependent methyltransferase